MHRKCTSTNLKCTSTNVKCTSTNLKCTRRDDRDHLRVAAVRRIDAETVTEIVTEVTETAVRRTVT